MKTLFVELKDIILDLMKKKYNLHTSELMETHNIEDCNGNRLSVEVVSNSSFMDKIDIVFSLKTNNSHYENMKLLVSTIGYTKSNGVDIDCASIFTLLPKSILNNEKWTTDDIDKYASIFKSVGILQVDVKRYCDTLDYIRRSKIVDRQILQDHYFYNHRYKAIRITVVSDIKHITDLDVRNYIISEIKRTGKFPELMKDYDLLKETA